LRRALALVVVALLWIAAVSPVRAERLVTALSSQTIEITSGFTGERLTLFGNIEPDSGEREEGLMGPYNVAVIIEGPLMSQVARQESNRFGIWSNTDQVLFKDFPSFYRVLASGRLSDLSNPVELTERAVLPEDRARVSAQAEWWKATVFGRQLVRLMTEKGLVGVDEHGVQFLSSTAFSASVSFPSDITNGPFLARVLVFKDGEIVAEKVEGFGVRKVGFERFLGNAARQYGLVYGFACVLLAIGTGWIGGVVFRR
jgi:uncharacterized protein (TIGR02186 family)